MEPTVRSLTQEAEKTGGFVRVVAREDDHRVLGIQGVGTHISELVGEWTLALEMGALLEDIAGTIHAHPTMTEMTHEAVLEMLIFTPITRNKLNCNCLLVKGAYERGEL